MMPRELCAIGHKSAQRDAAHWRQATPRELDAVIPDRAPVVAERVETERTSMTGVVDARGRYLAAAVLITAGYSANGKYSEYLLAQAPLRIGDTQLPAGKYLIGWTRSADGLDIVLSEAISGREVAHVVARQDPAARRVEQVRIWPPSTAGDGMVQLGRFAFHFHVD